MELYASYTYLSTAVLIVDELLGVLPLLVGRLLEPLGEPVQGDVVPGKVGGHGEVGVAGVELHVDLLVDQAFRFSVEVLLHLRNSHDVGVCWFLVMLKLRKI